LRLKASASELEVLRATATENLRPQLVEARNAAEVCCSTATVDLPLTQPIVHDGAGGADVRRYHRRPRSHADGDDRLLVTAADRQVSIRNGDDRVELPVGRAPDELRGSSSRPCIRPSGTPLRRDVSASVAVQLPLFTGFRRMAELHEAQIELDKSRLQLGQLREGVQVEYQRARGERARALSSIAARTRNVEQAQRVHDLTVLRYEQGLATQLEVSDGRLALLQARTNLAQATADFLLADAGVDRLGACAG
jgi:hypothetical protein